MRSSVRDSARSAGSRDRLCSRAAPSASPSAAAAWRSLLALGVATHLGCVLGCATQQATSQAMTIGGAAAVIIGASMAADRKCVDDTPEGGGVGGFCSSGLSSGGRKAGTAIAIAGAGLAAAGYALEPKGPDRIAGANSLPPPAGPYRLIRPPAPPEPEPIAAPGAAVAPAPAEERCALPAASPAPEGATARDTDGPSPDASRSCPANSEAAAPVEGSGDADRSQEPRR